MAALPLPLVGALLLLYAHALPARSQSRPLTLHKHFQKVAPDPRQLPRSFFDVTHFAKCPKNHYRLVLKWQGVKGCVRCPAGRTRAADDFERGKRGCRAPTPAPTSRATMPPHRQTTPAPTPCARGNDCVCSAGQYASTRGTAHCVLCPAGKYSRRHASRCSRCASGRFAQRGSSLGCLSCPAGQVQPAKGAGSCTACKAGRFAPPEARATICAHCPPGKHSTAAQEKCHKCKPGRWGGFASAGARCPGTCRAGRYGHAGATTAACSGPCPAGRWGRAGQGTKHCSGVCPAGRHGAAGMSTGPLCGGNCPRGRISPHPGAAVCTSCAAGRYQPIGEQTTCKACPEGKFARSQVSGTFRCKECGFGFSSVSAASSCFALCTAGQYTVTTGRAVYGIKSIACRRCSIGQYTSKGGERRCHMCWPGQFVKPPQDGCSACAAGYFADKMGTVHCQRCPIGFRPRHKGAAQCLRKKDLTQLQAPPSPAPTPHTYAPTSAPTPAPTLSPTPAPPTPMPTPAPCRAVAISDGATALGTYWLRAPGLWVERRKGGRSLFRDAAAGVWAVADHRNQPPYVLQCPSTAYAPYAIVYADWSLYRAGRDRWPGPNIRARCVVDDRGHKVASATTSKGGTTPSIASANSPQRGTGAKSSPALLTAAERSHFAYAVHSNKVFTTSPTHSPTPMPTPWLRKQLSAAMSKIVVDVGRAHRQPSQQSHLQHQRMSAAARQGDGDGGSGDAVQQPSAKALGLALLSHHLLAMVLACVLVVWMFALLVWLFLSCIRPKDNANAVTASERAAHGAGSGDAIPRQEMTFLTPGDSRGAMMLGERECDSLFDPYH